MPRNKLDDLNNHLFEQLERLNDKDISEEQLDKEIKRAKALSDISMTIIETGKLSLQATKLKIEYGRSEVILHELLETKDK